MAVREPWPAFSRTKSECRVECSHTRWESVGCWGMALSSTCTSLEWDACFGLLQQQQKMFFCFLFFYSQMLWHRNKQEYSLPGDRLRANLVWKSQASLSRYSSDITTTILLHLQGKVKKRKTSYDRELRLIWNTTMCLSAFQRTLEFWFCSYFLGKVEMSRSWLKWPCIAPFLYEFTRDGPHTGAWEDISVKNTEFQLELRLFQLSDHHVNKLKVTRTVADERIEQLRGT